MAKSIMLQGTMSNVGKSFLTAALCRIFRQDGYSAAPFKSQNMALNSFITPDGAEIGRAQALQAEAAGIEPSALMNPILLKPTTDVGSQVIVNGKVRGNMRAADYFRYKKELIPDIVSAYETLADRHDIIVIEGAGSPVELNLKADDIVNMGLAKLVKSPVLLVGDIDRGGVFAQLIGTLELLEKRFGFTSRPKVAVVGIGPGEKRGMTIEASEAVLNAECLIGAKRMIGSARPDQISFEAVSPDAIVDFIREHKEISRFAVLMSGDVGFYSGAKKLVPKLDFCELTVIPGVSSLAYLCAKTGASYEDAVSVSLHGRDAGIVPAVRRNRLVFALVGGDNGAGRLIDELNEAGLYETKVTVGERLGYGDERITGGSAAEMADREFDPLSAVLIENSAPESAAPGLPDEAFLRNPADKPVVPMTKSEVRAVVMAKLRLNADSVCWDIGAGTGSVTVEAALSSPRGSVYAVEKKPEAVELLKENVSKFGLKNVSVTEGEAPEALSGLPAPTHAFIGGSSGNMRGIVSLILDKNPRCRIVAAAISLETAAELCAIMKETGFAETEVVCLNVSKARRAGDYNLMIGQNPVYIFTLQK